MNLLTPFDIFSLFALWWTASVALESGHEVDDWSRAFLNLALVGVQVSSFLGAITLAVEPSPLRWWVRGLLYSGTVFAGWFYDRRFGISRHGRMAREGAARRLNSFRARINGRSPGHKGATR